MVSEVKDIEPIIPMCLLASRLKCQVQWSDEGITIEHPRRGLLPVCKEGGCPQILRALAMELIEEIEEAKEGVRLKGVQLQEEFNWMCNLVDTIRSLANCRGHQRGAQGETWRLGKVAW